MSGPKDHEIVLPGDQPAAAPYDGPSTPPAHVGLSQGAVFVERDGESIPAAAGEPVVNGDVVRTESGRVDIWSADGAELALDDRSELDPAWFAGVNTVLVTAGASAPEDLVQELIVELIDKQDRKSTRLNSSH